MQNPDLKDFLSRVIDPVEGQLLCDAYDILSSIGANEHEFCINQLLMTVDTDEYSNTIVGIRESLQETLQFRLLEHGVKFNNLSIPHMTQCLIALVSIDDYADPFTIWNITINDGSPEERLCDILEFFTPYRWVDYIDIIERVNNDLIIAIRKLTAANVKSLDNLETDVGPVNVTRIAIRDRLLAYSDGSRDFCIFRLIADGSPLGLQAIDYLQAGLAFLTILSADDLSKELFRIYLASDIKDTDLIASASQDLSLITKNLDLVTGTYSRLQALFREYHDESI